MATSDFSQLRSYLDLQDMSGSAGEALPSSVNGVIYYSSGSMHMRDDLAVNGAVAVSGKITNVTDPTNNQDAATKAYVDSQLTAQDLDFQGDSGGALSIDLDSEVLDIAGGTGLETAGSSNTLTVSISNGGVDTTQLAADAVDGTKIADNAVNSEHIALGALDQEHYSTGSIDSNHLAGSIANAKLANSAITIAGSSTSLGGSISAAVIAAAVDGEDMAITALTDLDFKTAGNKTIFDTVGANTLTVGASGTTVAIAGNLSVAGTTTTVDSTQVQIGDRIVELNTAGASGDAGLYVQDASTNQTGSLLWDSDQDAWMGGLKDAEVHFADLSSAQTLSNKTITAPDINGGTADALTSLSIANNVDVGDFTVRAKGLLADDLTSGRVVFAGTNGVLSDDSDMTFSGDTLTVTKLGAFEAAGAINFASQAMTNVDINSGTVDGADVTVGAGKTLDVSAGTLTLAAGQIAHAALAGDAVDGDNIADNAVNSEHIALGALDQEHYSSGSIDSNHLAGNIANAKLANSSLSIGGATVSLGGSSTNLSNVTNLDIGSAGDLQIFAGVGANTLTLGHSSQSTVVFNQGAVLGGFHIGAADGYSSDGASFDTAGSLSMKGALSVGANNSGGAQAGNQDFIVFGQSQGKNVFFDASADKLFVNGAFQVSGDSTIVGDIAMNGDLTLESAHDVKARAFITYSDRELKTNIQPMNNALEKVMKLEAVSYDLKAGKKNEIGFIAQEVAKVVPEVCALDKNGIGRGIDYSRMSTLLVGALKAQQTQIEDLKRVISKLQK